MSSLPAVLPFGDYELAGVSFVPFEEALRRLLAADRGMEAKGVHVWDSQGRVGTPGVVGEDWAELVRRSDDPARITSRDPAGSSSG